MYVTGLDPLIVSFYEKMSDLHTYIRTSIQEIRFQRSTSSPNALRHTLVLVVIVSGRFCGLVWAWWGGRFRGSSSWSPWFGRRYCRSRVRRNEGDFLSSSLSKVEIVVVVVARPE